MTHRRNGSRRRRNKKKVRFLDQQPPIHHGKITKVPYDKTKYTYDKRKVPAKPCIKYCRLCHLRSLLGPNDETTPQTNPVGPVLASCGSLTKNGMSAMEQTIYNYFKMLNNQWKEALVKPKGNNQNCVDHFKKQNSQKHLKNRVRKNIMKVAGPRSGQYFSRIKRLKQSKIDKYKSHKPVPKKAIQKIVTESLIYGTQNGILEKDGYSFKLAKPYRLTYDIKSKQYATQPTDNTKTHTGYRLPEKQDKSTYTIAPEKSALKRCPQQPLNPNSSKMSTITPTTDTPSEELSINSKLMQCYLRKLKKKPYPPRHSKHSKNHGEKVELQQIKVKRKSRASDSRTDVDKYRVDTLYFPHKKVELERKIIDKKKYRAEKPLKNDNRHEEKEQRKKYDSESISTPKHHDKNHTKHRELLQSNMTPGSSYLNNLYSKHHKPKRPLSSVSTRGSSKLGLKKIRRLLSTTKCQREPSRSRYRSSTMLKSDRSRSRSTLTHLRNATLKTHPRGRKMKSKSLKSGSERSKSEPGNSIKNRKKLGYEMTSSLQKFLRRRERELKKKAKDKKSNGTTTSFLDKVRNWIHFQHLIAPWFKTKTPSTSLQSVRNSNSVSRTVSTRSCLVCSRNDDTSTHSRTSKNGKHMVERKHLNKSLGSISLFDMKQHEHHKKGRANSDKSVISLYRVKTNNPMTTSSEGDKKGFYDFFNKARVKQLANKFGFRSNDKEPKKDYPLPDNSNSKSSENKRKESSVFGSRPSLSWRPNKDIRRNSYGSLIIEPNDSSMGDSDTSKEVSLQHICRKRTKSPIDERRNGKKRNQDSTSGIRERSRNRKRKRDRTKSRSRNSRRDSLKYPDAKRRKSCSGCSEKIRQQIKNNT